MDFVSTRKLFVFVVVLVMCFCYFITFALMNTGLVGKFFPLSRIDKNVTKPLAIPCLDRQASLYGRVEDIFCMNTCKMSPEFKNPCFFDYLEGGQKKLRCIPYFYVLGVSKAGSTDIYKRLLSHPQVIGNRGVSRKETGFWSWRRYGVFATIPKTTNQTNEFFLEMFRDTASSLENDNSVNIITGDGSPMDFFEFRRWFQIPQNVGRNEPIVLTPHLIKHFHNGHSPKFIITFREPIERAFSHYLHQLRGTTALEFHKDVVTSLEVIDMCVKENGKRYCYFSDELHFRVKATIQYSCYSIYLQEWFNVFPRSSFFISRLEDRTDNLEQTYIDLFQFLEIDPMSESQLLDLAKSKVFNKSKSKVGLNVLPETVSLLREFYQECNADLAEILNDDRYLWNDIYENENV